MEYINKIVWLKYSQRALTKSEHHQSSIEYCVVENDCVCKLFWKTKSTKKRDDERPNESESDQSARAAELTTQSKKRIK